MLATLSDALALLGHLDPQVLAIVWLSFQVSLGAVLIGGALGLPLGALLAVAEFRGRAVPVVLLNGFMGLPSVIVGVLVYLLLSRSGPFGSYGLLFSPGAMIIAQSVLVVPLIASLTRQTIEDVWRHHAEELRALHFSHAQSLAVLLYDCRYSLVVAVLAGVGRAMSEVGAVMIVGGNIDGYTRVMTTAIALETQKGDLALSVALGLVLLSMILAVNLAAFLVRNWAMKRYG